MTFFEIENLPAAAPLGVFSSNIKLHKTMYARNETVVHLTMEFLMDEKKRA